MELILPTPLHVGWHDIHPDVSLNFQINRWAAYGGPRWIADLGSDIARITDYGRWIDTFLGFGERALADGRALDAALHFRAAEFFMSASDERKASTRRRLIDLFREAAGVSLASRREVPCGPARLPVWDFPADPPQHTVVLFGGFDSYIEEFFPVIAHLHQRGLRVVAFEGPGQGAVLEEQGVPMDPAWDKPVSAVLDALDLDDVTLVGISLGGCLVLRAAAFEPRVRRVVAFDVLADFGACLRTQLPAALAIGLRASLALRANPLIDRLARARARVSPVAAWGLSQAMRVFGCDRPSAAFAAAEHFHTRDVSSRVTQPVLLLAGAEDHYVPLEQLWQQARALRRARSLTTRVFTRQEHAQAHCQVGNFPLALQVMTHWLAGLETT